MPFLSSCGEVFRLPRRRHKRTVLLDDEAVTVDETLNRNPVEGAVIDLFAVFSGSGGPQRSTPGQGAQNPGDSGKEKKFFHGSIPFSRLRLSSAPIALFLKQEYSSILKKSNLVGFRRQAGRAGLTARKHCYGRFLAGTSRATDSTTSDEIPCEFRKGGTNRIHFLRRDWLFTALARPHHRNRQGVHSFASGRKRSEMRGTPFRGPHSCLIRPSF